MTEKECGVIEFPPNDKPCEREAGHSGGHTPSRRAAFLLHAQDLRIAELERQLTAQALVVSNYLAERDEARREVEELRPFGPDFNRQLTAMRKERDSARAEVEEKVRRIDYLMRTHNEAVAEVERLRLNWATKSAYDREQLRAIKAEADRDSLRAKLEEARAAIRTFIADYEVSGSLPNYALNRLRRVLDSEGT